MSLFGFGKKKKERLSDDEKTLREAKKHPTLGPMTEFIEALGNADEDEMRAAVSRTMKCGKCGHDFVMAQGFQKSDTADGFAAVNCPKCGQHHFSIGRGKR